MNKKLVKERISNYYIDFSNKELKNKPFESTLEVAKFYQGLLKEIDKLSNEESVTNSMMND